MKFYQVEKDVWTILVYAKNNEESPILDFLFDDRDYFNEKTKMLTLFKYISTHGPGKNEDISKHLQGNILEFKRGPKKGPKIRVLYFYDKNKVIICTHAFMKRNETIQEEIDSAEKIREKYLIDKAKGQINILEIEAE